MVVLFIVTSLLVGIGLATVTTFTASPVESRELSRNAQCLEDELQNNRSLR